MITVLVPVYTFDICRSLRQLVLWVDLAEFIILSNYMIYGTLSLRAPILVNHLSERPSKVILPHYLQAVIITLRT